MMDASKVDEIATASAKKWVKSLALERWRVTLFVGACQSPEHSAECEISLPYNRASIWIDPAKAADESSIDRSIRHECIHILISEFDVLDLMTQAVFDPDSPEWQQYQVARKLAMERTVYAIEAALDRIDAEGAVDDA